MPPLVPRKRLRATPPPQDKTTKPNGSISVERRKPTFDDLDTPNTDYASALLQGSDGDDSASSLSSLSDGDFEDVPLAKRQKNGHSDDEDEDIEFEDVEAPTAPAPDCPAHRSR